MLERYILNILNAHAYPKDNKLPLCEVLLWLSTIFLVFGGEWTMTAGV